MSAELYRQLVAGFEKETSWAKPGVEAVVVDLGLDLGKYLLPEIHIYIIDIKGFKMVKR